VAAWAVARHVLGVPWQQIPADPETLRVRLREWERAGIWDKIREAAQGAGHLDALTVT
jgi:hypothetical protein